MLGNLSWIDYAIILASVIALRIASLHTRKYMRGVADFLSANRSAGRYLLTIASAMGGIGVVNVVANYEVLFTAGLSPAWWGNMAVPISVIILLSGWIYYRWRETRALTMAQFLEMRYSKNFRIFAGIMCWLSGIINFGVFPAVAARFIVYYCGLPDYFNIPGIPFAFNTFAVVMAVDMCLALSFVTMGGQISVMITDCLQGMFVTVAYIAVGAAVMIHFTWPQMVEALQVAGTADASHLNPFHTSKVQDFNFWFYLIGMFGTFYTYQSWQGAQGFFSSARTPHEQKMGGIIALWRAMPHYAALMLVSLAALVVLRLPEYAQQAESIQATLATIPSETIQGQMRVPIAMVHVLPIGIKGLFATVIIFMSFSNHDTYLHSWGSIFVQDVYLPIRRKALSPQQHVRLLRYSCLFVAVFAYLFSLYYPISQPIFMFFAITGTIWLGGSGTVIIAGLYWKRGTTTAAYLALIMGSGIGTAGLILEPVFQHYLGKKFPINGQYMWLIAMVTSLIVYVIVSLITGRNKTPFNLDKMLHRGRYAVAGEHEIKEVKQSVWQKIVGITPEFSRSDKVLSLAMIGWNAAFFLWFVIFSIANLVGFVSDAAWAKYWHVTLISYIVLSVPTAVWFTIGGLKDIKALFKHLDKAERDDSDDGSVLSEEDGFVLMQKAAGVAEDELRPKNVSSTDHREE